MNDPFNPASLGGIKSVQSGVYAGAGATINIKPVDITKTFVVSVSKGSAGTVATNSNMSGTLSISWGGNGGGTAGGVPMAGTYSGAMSGGTTNLTTAQYSARLTSKSTISTDGPCEWQVVEFN